MQILLLRTFLSWTLLVVHCQGGRGVRQVTLLSGIFGFGNNDPTNNKNQGTDKDNHNSSPPPPHPPTSMGFGRSASASVPPQLRNNHPNKNEPPHQQTRMPPPPPPPPPRLFSATTTTTTSNDATSTPTQQEDEPESHNNNNNLPPPPPQSSSSSQWGMGPPPQQQQQPSAHLQGGAWMNQPPPGYYDTSNNYYSTDHEYLHAELQSYLAREGDLVAQLDNLTATLVVMEQREDLHMIQLDVLTERVMDVEAQAAQDRNMAAAFRANCTALHQTLATMQDELNEWQRRCQEFVERHNADQAALEEFENKIKEKQLEAEGLAIAMENLRLAERRKGSSQSHRKGMLSWMWSFIFPRKEDYPEAMRDEAFELAKSTLLRALQEERASVHELESAVLSLQQNNSAISEMVESRDSIIDELNNRIAVFEEDKVVLKAALRQLQKEMKEEAPKAHKLMDDLGKAEKEIKRLQSEMNSVIQTHQEEILMLQQVISSKQKAISETESNLTAIGTYVDRLEERLTSFAVTRRDMEIREKKCKDIEELVIAKEKECSILQEKVEEMTKNEEEVKKVLEELATERLTLQKENRKLYTEREFRMAEQEQLHTKCMAFENATKALQDELHDWKSRSGNVVVELDDVRLANRELQSKLERMTELEQELETTKERCLRVEANLKDVSDALSVERLEKTQLEEMAHNQTTMLQNMQAKVQAMEQSKAVAPLRVKEEERNVPLRKIRKQLSKATGIHGFITPPSVKNFEETKNSSAGGDSKSEPRTHQRPSPSNAATNPANTSPRGNIT